MKNLQFFIDPAAAARHHIAPALRNILSIVLREYQISILDQARDLMRSGVKSILVQSPTGSGKTALTAQMIKTAAERQMSSWFVVHRRELVLQSIRAFNKIGVRHGVVAADFLEDKRQRVQICSIQTLARRLDQYNPPSLIVWDETHHLGAATWERIFDQFPDAYHIGLTATPVRLDGKGLGKYYQRMICGPTVEWLIQNKYLAPYKLYAPAGINLSSVGSRMGDYIKSELTAVVDRPTITGDVIREYQKICPGKRAVVFCVSVEHSKHVVAQFMASGIPSEHVDGETPKELRDAALKRFASGTTRVISNVELFGEGFDLPAMEAVVLLRPTQSLGLYLQQVGRVLRPHPGKTHAIILDHAGNCERHGLPDEPRDWQLTYDEDHKRANKVGPSVKICPRCFAAQFPGPPNCKWCGHLFEVNSREVDHVEGDLTLIDPATLRMQRNREQVGASTEADLIAIAKKRGYKFPHRWAHHVMQARQRKKLGANN